MNNLNIKAKKNLHLWGKNAGKNRLFGNRRNTYYFTRVSFYLSVAIYNKCYSLLLIGEKYSI
ncbi:hypothetical protein AS4_12680 [Acinetobacter guillouiae]|nr:hypothetical protein AS4_12680 [Acinetobacter guillouiae]